MAHDLSFLNFRDLGGVPLLGAKRVRRGTLYRSQGPKRLTADHRRELHALGLRTICDLRSRAERTEDGQACVPLARVLHCEIPDDFGAQHGIGRAMLREDPSARSVAHAMRASYARMPAALHRYLPGIADAIAEEQLPVLIHCTAGKDRTGVTVALLLMLLGASRAAVVEDYLLSRCFGEHLRAQGALAELPRHYGIALDGAGVDALVGVRADYLETAISAVEHGWGSVAAYFASAGVDLARQQRLRDVLSVSD